MDLLFLRVLNLFPLDLSRHIRQFLLRTDWRSCRSHEANLIGKFNQWTKRVLDDDALDWFDSRIKIEFPIVFGQKELDVYLKEWNLFGRWYLILQTQKDYYWHLSRTFTVNKYDYIQWYRQSFHELHHAWRFPLLR